MYNYWRKVMALPFLPGDVIAETFGSLSMQVSELCLQELNAYITETRVNNEL